jgi:putative salt-induced outer membrane protein
MISIKKCFLVFVLLVLNASAIAATTGERNGAAASAVMDKGWQSTAELGVVVTSGNTKTSSTSGKFDTNKEVEKWRFNLHAETLSSSSDNVKSAEKYLASGQANYKFNKFDYMFGLLTYTKDLFSGYEYQSTIAAGYGRRLLDDDTMTLDLEAGPGVRFSKVDTSIDPKAEAQSKAILRTAAKYRWKITDHSKFSEDLTSEASHESSVTKSVTGLTAKVNSSLAMKLTVTLTRTTHVPVGTKENDTETALTLVYSF